jgi:hypothetical protein
MPEMTDRVPPEAGARRQPPEPPGETAEHRVLLPDGSGEWSLWRCACLRGAGFPVSDLERLAATPAAAAADRLAAAEDDAERRRAEALAAAGDELRRGERQGLALLVKAIRKLKKGKLPAADALPAAVREAVERCAAADAEVGRLAEEYAARFTAAAERLARELRAIARDGRFREAVLWLNRRLVEDALDRLAERDGDGQTTWKTRQREQLVVSYLQRFCAKNDTIGFFGPVGWATVGEAAEPIAVRHGPDFLAGRRVFFEGWGIDALAAALAAQPGLRPALAPRRGVFVRADGELVAQAPGAGLPPEMRALLALCDGRNAARQLAARLVAAGTLPDESAVYALLERLAAAGLVTWGFDLPLALEPERALRRRIEALDAAADDGAERQAALQALAELEADRRAVELAAGDDRALDRALRQLEDRFTRLTGLGASRGHGETYAGRTLVYEDCRRGTEVDFGAGLLAELAAPLGLLLTSARWLTWAAAEIHRQRFEQTFEELRRETGAERVELAAFCRQLLPVLIAPQTSPVRQQVLPEFRRRWAEVLALPDARARRVSYTSEELRDRVLRAFAAPGPGWTTARHHSPDLLIAASGPEAIRRGDYSLVLGELHVGNNTLATNLFVAQHPSPQELVAAMERDVPEPCVFPTLPKAWQQEESDGLLGVPLPGLTGRLAYGLAAAKDLFLEVTPAPSEVPGSRALAIADLYVERGHAGGSGEAGGAAGGGLRVTGGDGSRSWDLLAFLQTVIQMQIVGVFKIFPPEAHWPRVTIDRLVVWRESWMAPAASLEFAGAATEAQRFAGARRWAHGRGLPRRVFVKAPYEQKPFLLDLDSPLSVELFARVVRRSVEKSQGKARISFSEMVPAPEDAWLPDRLDRRYASELRLVAFDRSG